MVFYLKKGGSLALRQPPPSLRGSLDDSKDRTPSQLSQQ